MKLALFLLPVLFVLFAIPLAAQEQETAPEAEIQGQAFIPGTEAQDTADDQAVPPENDRLYVISAYEFNTKGRTRPSALIYKGEFKIGETLQGQAELDEYIRDKIQLLTNQRILKDSVAITYSVGEQAEDGSYPVTLAISTEDSWNIIALPRPYYKSDSGFDLSIRARDYNFLGTMNPLRVNLGYKYDEKGHSSFQFDILSNMPFNAFGYHWDIKFNNYFNYRPDVEEPYFYQNITGLSVEIPFRKTTFTFGFDEASILNEENADIYKESLGAIPGYPNFQNGLYMSSRLSASWKIPTSLFVSRYGELTYTPVILATFNHELANPDWALHEFRKGPFLGWGHSLGFEKIDWHTNYRDGLSVFITNTYNYDFHHYPYPLYINHKPLSTFLSIHGAGYFIINNFFGISSRLQYRHWFYNDPNYYDSASDGMRGIADKKISADYMLSLNTDFPFRVLLFTPSEWFKTRHLRFFDFELHASPVIDLALYHDPRTSTSFHPKNIAASGGLELIVFPAFMRNFIVRFGYTMNLRELITERKLPEGDNREIYLIMGHFY